MTPTAGTTTTSGIDRAHAAALRSIARTVEETAQPHPPEVARNGIHDLLEAGEVLCLTGAGISTDSGIPDYRGPSGSLSRHRPMTFQEFKYDAAARRRYWARSFVGWRHMGAAEPNRGHEILAQWQHSGLLTGLVTQNVDGLHAAAAQKISDTGGANTVELHGDLSRVVCLTCGNDEDRRALDTRLEEANPGYAEAAAVAAENMNPDGDVTLADEWVQRFHLVHCLICDADTLKPDVVYFGENVPAERKSAVEALIAASASLLVVGSSMAVMSGFSIALKFAKAQKPIAVINGGPSRVDPKASWRWRTQITPALEELSGSLQP
ncbi:NAD-dependent protein deacetylase [Nesterenkonia sp. MY13]|uniref:protein acetyllysine N-acetyltransferase n=1 Tax=Nesterenkonia sedimenti TaxID=1463632 RepID=A0A7X8TJP5_9MICC|nr:Sir2 family NAD-dependent protein deacetylase [Nesterenkonia sedimenti]NLS09918.1 NAD-dependent protein deacetylase [Nesterenkonia sedimenti]